MYCSYNVYGYNNIDIWYSDFAQTFIVQLKMYWHRTHLVFCSGKANHTPLNAVHCNMKRLCYPVHRKPWNSTYVYHQCYKCYRTNNLGSIHWEGDEKFGIIHETKIIIPEWWIKIYERYILGDHLAPLILILSNQMFYTSSVIKLIHYLS